MPTRKIRAAEGGWGALAISGRHPAVARSALADAVELVRSRERRQVDLSVTFVGPARIRALNARWKGSDRPTDVMAFSWIDPDGRLTGDTYICPRVAATEARARGIPVRQELLRLVIHATLHVLGYDHPDDERRTRSPMWRRQERYLAWLS